MMQHPILGNLLSENNENDSYDGKVSYKNSIISLHIEIDQEAKENVILLAVSVYKNLSNLDSKAKTIIVNDLLDTYNNGWNECLRENNDGEYETVANKHLTAKQFRNKFTLISIGITGASCVELWYKDNDLFGGHSVFVSSLEGIDFKNAKAEMFG